MSSSFDELTMNRIRLDSCKQHKFKTEGLRLQSNEKVRCTECDGEMSLIEANQYVRGFVAAGGDFSLVWEGWNEPDNEEIAVRCPQCLGKCFVEPRPNDYHDCDLCEATGYVSASKAREVLKG